METRDLETPDPQTPDPGETTRVRESLRERVRATIFELKPPPLKAPASGDPVTTLFAAFAAVIACLILGLMVYRVTSPQAMTPKAMLPPTAPQAQELDLSPMVESPAPSLATTALAASPQSAQSSTPAKQAASKDSGSAADVVVPAADKKNIRVPAPAPPAGGGLAIYDEKGKLIYGSPIHSQDDSTVPAAKPKKASPKPDGKSAKANAADAASPSATPLNLTEGRYVRLKPDLAESLLDERVEPDYPDAARRAHIQGSVILETLIGANGKVQEVAPVSGPPQLAEAAANAVRQWKYKPFTVDGQKVPIRTQVTVTFMLAQ